MLNEAERLARLGFAIHWLHPKSKRPVGDNWSTASVMSIERLRATWRDGRNVGVRLGKWSVVGGEFLHVIDMDIRDTAYEKEALSALERMFPSFATYPAVQSGSGGASRHFYITSDQPFSSKKLAHSDEKIRGTDGRWHWAWEIELFGTGKQVAIPPSIHPDTEKPYVWLRQVDADDIELGLGPHVASSKLATLVGSDDREPDNAEDDDERVAPIGLTVTEIRDILSDLTVNEWRDDRDGWLAVGFAIHHETGGSDQGYKLWSDFSKESDKYDSEDQKRVWKSFRSSGVRKPLRMATLVSAAREARYAEALDNMDDFDDLDELHQSASNPLTEFDDILGNDPAPVVSKREQKLKKSEVDADLGHVPKKIARLNKKHALAFVKGKTIVITEKSDSTVDYGPLSALHEWYENDRVPTEKSTEPVSKMWLRHKMRREFQNGVVFAPGLVREGCYNHWKGWSVEADPEGSCELWLQHLRSVICCNDEILFRYALGWFAHIVQKPWEKPGVAFIVRGKKGRGKDTIMDYFGGLIADHHVKIANQEQMVGKFNAHQEKALVLHVEEGFWAGNKQAEGSLKHLITSEKVQIERKGIDSFSVDSYLRIFMSSNEDWVVPATSDERRYFVLDVSDERRGDHVYFRALRQEMNNGGRSALLHYLMHYDLSDFEVRSVPDTKALSQQKLQGLRGFERFWFDILDSLEMPVDYSIRGGKAGRWLNDFIIVGRQDLYAKYEQWLAHRRYEKSSEGVSVIGRRLSEMLNGEIGVYASRSGKKQIKQHVLPPVPRCRFLFEKWLGSAVDWDEPLPSPDSELPEFEDDLADI